MANFSRITDWVLKNSSELQLEVKKVTWVNEWLPGYFDFQTKIKLDDNWTVGRGTNKNEIVAFEKSVSEAIERAAVKNHSEKIYCGVAAHYDPNVAIWSPDHRCKIQGFVADFGGDPDVSAATEHAVLECLREAVAVFFDEEFSLNAYNLKKDGNPKWHFLISQ